MSKALRIADGLTLPVDVVTQTVAIVAKRRAGKSYTMRRIVEQLMNAGQQVVLVDPKGDQWGLRSAADGKGPGLPIVILGGERADVPLEVGAGEMVAKLAVEERVSILIDLSLFRKADVARFMTDFLETVYRLKAREVYRTPLMLVIDEADAIAPQKPQPGEERMLGAAEDIVRRGGQRGLGCILVTQRTAVLNKNVLTQAEILVALRTIAPQDLAAMNAWIDVHGEPEQKKTLMASLPALPVGDAWFWSPGWPTADGIFKRVHVLPIETFDSGATPKPGEKRIEPKTLADVDLDAVKRQMAETIERAKADDPKELKKQLAQVRGELARAQHLAAKQGEKQPTSVREPKTVEILTDADRERLTAHRAQLVAIAEELGQKSSGVIGEAEAKIESVVARTVERLGALLADQRAEFETVLQRAGFAKILDKLDRVTAAAPTRALPVVQSRRATGVAMSTSMQAVARVNGDASLGKVHRAFLTVLANRQGKATSRNQLAIFSGYSAKSRHVDNTISACRTNGWLDGGSDALRVTDAGLTALGHYDALPSGAELLAYWIREAGAAPGAMLKALADVYPQTLSRDEVADRSGYSVQSRHVDNSLSYLRTLELISGDRSALRASEELFD
jgi:hypothetical protein